MAHLCPPSPYCPSQCLRCENEREKTHVPHVGFQRACINELENIWNLSHATLAAQLSGSGGLCEKGALGRGLA